MADRPYGKFYDYYSVSLETFGSTHVLLLQTCFLGTNAKCKIVYWLHHVCLPVCLCLSVHPDGTSGLHIKFDMYFSKTAKKIQAELKSDKNNRYLT